MCSDLFEGVRELLWSFSFSVVLLKLPPLRHRRADIPLLADHFLARLNTSIGAKIDRISDEALKKMEAYDWPGNDAIASIYEHLKAKALIATHRRLRHME
jgi:transcriptional regulator with GAF, ATPase, and Fis domain